MGESDISVKIRTVSNSANGQEAVKYCADHVVDLVIMDINMPVMDGIEATKIIKKKSPHTKILMLTMQSSDRMIAKSYGAGATGYLTKGCTFTELVSAIENILRTGFHSNNHSTAALIREVTKIENPIQAEYSFSNREIGIIELICQEKSNSEISNILGVSQRTIENQKLNILKKTQAKNNVGIVLYAIKNGIYKII